MKILLLITEINLLFYKLIKLLLTTKKIVFVFQAGKVGSHSACNFLKESERVIVFHDHHFSLTHNKMRNKKYLDIRALYLAFLLGKRINIITPIREPIERNISMFFNQILTMPKLYKLNKKFKFNRARLRQKFIAEFNHEYFLNWFQNNILNNFHIDVYSKPFNKKKGYQTYDWHNIDENKLKADHHENFINRKKNIRILIYQSELNNNIKKKIIANFLNIQLKTKFKNVNLTSKKYKNFSIKNVRNDIKKTLPIKLINYYLISKFRRHFY